MKRKSVTPTFKELLRDLKGMSFKEKLDHLWTYYKYHLLVVGLVGVFLATIITSVVNSNKDTLISGMLVNVNMKQTGFYALSDGYAERLGADSMDRVDLTSSTFENLETAKDVELSYNAAQVLVAKVSAGLLDYAIMDEVALRYYVEQEVFLDLRNFFTPEELEKLQEADLIFYAAGYEDENVDPEKEEADIWPVAIKITDWAFIQENVTNDGDIYLSISGHDPNEEAVRELLTYIYNWEGK